MKVASIEKPVAAETKTLPALYKSECNDGRDLIVLFVTKNSGIFITTLDHEDSPGDFYNDFVSCYSENTWTRLESGMQVTLTQE